MFCKGLVRGGELRETALEAVHVGKLTWELYLASEGWQLGEQDFGEEIGDSRWQEELKYKRLGVA